MKLYIVQDREGSLVKYFVTELFSTGDLSLEKESEHYFMLIVIKYSHIVSFMELFL